MSSNMIKLFNIDLGIIQAVWKKEGGQNKYWANTISKYRLLLIFPEEYNSTSLHKLTKKICAFCECTVWLKEAVLCCLSIRLWFLTESRCEAAYAVWNIFCITLKPSKTEEYSAIIHLFTDLHSSQICNLQIHISHVKPHVSDKKIIVLSRWR